MNTNDYSAFVGTRLLATGPLDQVREASRPYADNKTGPLLVFAHSTGRQEDFDWRETAPQEPSPDVAKPGPGRPKLGVVSVEVTLLPRHWAWLEAQPTRASGTLRRLVEDAMAREATDPRKRREVLGKILWSVAGNLPGFEEASRALYAGHDDRLRELVGGWPEGLATFVSQWLSPPSPS